VIYAVHQPHYLPYPGYLSKVDAADTFVFLENVQYVRREWQNRNRIKGPDGLQWLTVPVKGEYKARISEMQIDYSVSWQEKHINTLHRFYSRSSFLHELELFAKIIEHEYKALSDLTISTTKFFLQQFGIETTLKNQASFADLPEDPNKRIIEIGKRLGADAYLSGAGGRNYMDIGEFERAGIEVIFQEYEAFPYTQFHGDFVPNLGSIDLLLCAGPDGFMKNINNENSEIQGAKS